MDWLEFLAILEKLINLIFLPVVFFLYKLGVLLLNFKIELVEVKKDIKILMKGSPSCPT